MKGKLFLSGACLLAAFLIVGPGLVLAQVASLSLSPASGTFNKGCSFSLDINLDTGGAATDGTDVVLLFDPSKLTVNSITPGTIYSDYPGSNFDNSAGKITVSGLSSVTSSFTGHGVLASLAFTVVNVATSSTQIKFDFDPNDKAKTTDSNVVDRNSAADILGNVTNGNYNLGLAPCSGQAPGGGGTSSSGGGGTVYLYGRSGVGGASGSGYTQSYPTALPKGGTGQLTATIAIVGSILTILGILGVALL